ncbi:MAG: adenylate/guanylate cyclase domain-containing protein [Dehalococcoidia bacterium]
MQLTLTINIPGESPLDAVLESSAVVFGRDAGCDVQLASPYVSRRHFRVEPDGDGGWRIADLGGRNPVTINGQPVTAPTALNPGDSIAVADVTIDVHGDRSAAGTVVFPADHDTRPHTNEGPLSGRGLRGIWQGQDLGPGGTLTIMFTDIERSTSMVNELGERDAFQVINAHNAVLREAFREFRGREAKRIGDGFLVLFASARDAIGCAVQGQRRLAGATSDFGPVRVRMGLHVGEVLWDENDIFGSAVSFAARVMGEAHGGQILISSLLRELVSVAGEFRFGEGREVTLKGFRGAQVLTPVFWEEHPPEAEEG